MFTLYLCYFYHSTIADIVSITVHLVSLQKTTYYVVESISSKSVQDLGGRRVTHVTASDNCLQACTCIFPVVKRLFGKISTSSTSAGLTLQSTFIDPSTPRPTTEQIRRFLTGFVRFCKAGSNRNHTLYMIIIGRTKIRIGLREKVAY
jgi:hypothetical protein